MLLSVLLPLVLNTIIFYIFLSFNAVHCTFQLALFRRRMTFVISAKFYSTDHLSRWGSLNSDHWNERASHSNKRNETRYPSFESIEFVHLTPQYPKNYSQSGVRQSTSKLDTTRFSWFSGLKLTVNRLLVNLYFFLNLLIFEVKCHIWL